METQLLSPSRRARRRESLFTTLSSSPPTLCFQSGRPPPGPERTMPAHVPPGRACGQGLHPIQNQTSLRPPGTGGGGGGVHARPRPTSTTQSSSSLVPGFSQTINISTKTPPPRTSPDPPPPMRVMPLALFKVTLIVSILQHTWSKLIYRNFSRGFFSRDATNTRMLCIYHLPTS